MINTLIHEGIDALSAESAATFRVDRELNELHLITQLNVRDAALAQFPLDLAVVVPMTDAVRSGSPIWIDDAEQRDRWFPLLKDATFAVRSSALIPISRGSTVIGVLALGFDHDHHFSESERMYCTTLAHRAALVLGPPSPSNPPGTSSASL